MLGTRTLWLVLLIVVVPVIRSAHADLTDAEVRAAIERGVAFLKSQQNPVSGGWREYPGQPGGLSALITLAMLNCGESVADPDMQKALTFLRGFNRPQMTYATSLRTMVFCAAEPDKDRLLIRQNVAWLEQIQLKNGERKGAWGYSDRQGRGDNSNTQFALLALNEAEGVGIDVNDATWTLALNYWTNTQNPDGSWSYVRGNPPSGSMTCAGISSSVIAHTRLNRTSSRVQGNQVRCCGAVDELDSVERALRWLGQKFSVRMNPGDRSWVFYYLYGVERVGRLTGRRFIGQHDWYREGAEVFVRSQDQFNGYWKGVGAAEADPLVSTALALLFLSKGRRAVVLGKLKYAEDRRWDLHPAGIPKLTHHIERRWKKDLTWQTIDFGVATDRDLLEAPVLFISGQESLAFAAQQKEHLKRYVSQGGFIFAEACEGDGCDGTAFDVAFRKLMKELFPDSQLRVLPADHPVWYAEERVRPSVKRPLLGIDACCRTSVVYCPANLSCFWELSEGPQLAAYPEPIQEEVRDCVGIGLNVVAYATNRVLKEKLDAPTLAAGDSGLPATARGVLLIPKLSHSGGSDDAPNAVANLLNFVAEKIEMRISYESRVLNAKDPSLHDFPILYVHGRRDFRLAADERKALGEYIRRGGFIIADAICANGPFAEAFRREMNAIFPEQALSRLPRNHELLTQAYGGYDVRTVTLNDPQGAGVGQRLETKLVKIDPLLEGMEVDGRLAILFSPYDLSCALESHETLECKGYIKADAARLGTNMILYALQQ